MEKEIIACLDGSSRAEAILPLAQGIVASMDATLSLLRIVADADDLPAEEIYMREQARLYGAEIRLIVAPNPATGIVEELRQSPGAMVAMTTHGRTAWMEAIVGGVALKVVRDANRPVLLYRPVATTSDTPRRIETSIVALDGSEFSERILPFVVDFAKSIEAKLMLVHAVRNVLENPISGAPQT
ncbi:MAG: universal stress protein, partial [Candidatus Binatia bacterium]